MGGGGRCGSIGDDVGDVAVVSSGSYGLWVVVAGVVLLVMFLLSFTVMALIIRSQAG